MANKNSAGTLVYKNDRYIERLIDKLDRRSKDGSDRENVDQVWQNHSTNENGERVWSF